MGPYDANTRQRPSLGLMLAYHLRRWPNIKPALGGRLVCVDRQSSAST